MDFAFYNVTSIHGFTSMLTVVCESTRMIWVSPITSKRAPVSIIRFILTTLKNEQYPYIRVIFDEYGALANSKHVTNLLVDDFNMSIENNGSNESYINGKIERHNRSINNMVRAGIIGSNKNGKKWCCAAETSAEVYE